MSSARKPVDLRDKVPRDADNDYRAGVVLAGETSLSSAVIHGDWVSSHNHYGRNRP